MKILVTGSCGFIFSNMVLYFLQHTEHKIVGVDKLTYAGSRLNAPEVKRYRLHVGDVCDYHFMREIFAHEKPDIVIHGAAESHVDNSIMDSHDFVRTNVLGTHSMLEAALKAHTPQKFINVSTDEVYGSVEEGFSIETDPLEPRSPYSSTKASADLLGQSYAVTHGLPIITTRCSNNYGPRQHMEKLIPKVITNIMTKQKIPLYGDGKNVREWIYVKDHFNAMLKIIESGEPGEVYNVSSGADLTNIEILNTLFEIMGEGQDLLEYVKDRPGHDRRYALNCDKLRALGWEPIYNLKEALAYTVNWYKKNTWFTK